MYVMDVQTRRELARDHVATLARTRETQPASPASTRARRRVGLWLVEVGLRLAYDRPLPTRA